MARHVMLGGIGMLLVLLMGCASAKCHTQAALAAPTEVWAEDFECYEPGTPLSHAGWVAHGSSTMVLSRTSEINPASMAIDGKLTSGRSGYACMHKLFERPIPSDRDLVVSFRMSCAADMNQACVGLYTNDGNNRRDLDPEGIRLWATDRTWYLQDCSFSEQGSGNNHGAIVGVDPYVDGTAAANIHVMGSAGRAWAEIVLPDGRTIQTPTIPIDTARVGSYRGLLVYIKGLTPKHQADIDDIRVVVMSPNLAERVQCPR